MHPALITQKIRKPSKTRSTSAKKKEESSSLPDFENLMVSSTKSMMNSSKIEPKRIRSSSDFRQIAEGSQNNQTNKDEFDDNFSPIKTKSKFFTNNQSAKKSALSCDDLNKESVLSYDNIKNHPFRSLIFSPEVTAEKLNNYISLVQRGLIYSKVCLKQPSAQYLKNKSINLSEKKSIVLDAFMYLVNFR